MLNSTEVIRYLEKKLGYRFNDLEVSHEEILENIRSETLITFSKYFPHQERTRINTQTDRVDDYVNMFYLDTKNEIININKIVSSSILGASAVTDLIHPTAAALMYGDPITRQLDMDLISATKNPITYVFYHPNKIEITPCSSIIENFVIFCNVVHDKTFATIPLNLQEQFLELCLYDTQDLLYRIRSRFPNLQTTFGSLELFIDELREAEDKKKTLIEEKFLKSSLKYGKRKKIIIA